MEIIIHDDVKLFEIQQAFQEAFPFLKLEFFRPAVPGEQMYAGARLVKEHQKTLHDIRGRHNTGVINIHGHQTAGALEKRFADDFGILAQVFRKSGNNWLFTTQSDSWTLEALNKRGQESSQPDPDREDEPEWDAYHEQP